MSTWCFTPQQQQQQLTPSWLVEVTGWPPPPRVDGPVAEMWTLKCRYDVDKTQNTSGFDCIAATCIRTKELHIRWTFFSLFFFFFRSQWSFYMEIQNQNQSAATVGVWWLCNMGLWWQTWELSRLCEQAVLLSQGQNNTTAWLRMNCCIFL